MKRFFKILFLAVLLAAGAAAALIYFSDQQLVVFQDGTVLVVDKCWKSGDSVFYETENELDVRKKEAVKAYGKRNFSILYFEARAIVLQYADWLESKINGFLSKKNISFNIDLMDPLTLMVLLLAFLVLWLCVRLLRKKARASKKKKIVTVVRTGDYEVPTRKDIVRFFSNVFKQQIGAEPDAPVQIVPLNSAGSGANQIYELRVKHMEDWAKRRMTIGPLGEESGSKSKCYYVIYDVHMVVKIPVKPITDFEKYIESIKKEVHIVNKLIPKECIIPKVSVVLGLIHSLPYSEETPPEKLEEQYINWLRRSIEYQEFLKINNSFMFFMDLSKYYFLGHILAELHDIQDLIDREISEYAHIIFDPAKFKGRYGTDTDAIFEIREVYNRCEVNMRRLIAKMGISAPIPMYQLQTWFHTHLAKKEITSGTKAYSDDFITELNRLLRSSLRENTKAVGVYRKIIKDYVYMSTFEQNKAQMAAISRNLLDLLAWFRRKRVSMRDLKPDNLFVAGDPDRYPLFLRSAGEFSLGIIDVETAVDFEKSQYTKTKQPLLGGTPFYATPSHFIKNDIITYKYANLGKILHLQDWHATLAMIYNVITGEQLFEQTAKLFGDIRGMMISVNRPEGYRSEIYEDASRIFWSSAVKEFQIKANETEKILKTVVFTLPPSVIHMFVKVLAKERKSISGAIRTCVASQTVFGKPQTRELLLKSPHIKICQFQTDLERKARQGENSGGPRTEAVIFLHQLADLKLILAHHGRMHKLLSGTAPKLSCHDILTFMFNVVANNMYRAEWGPLFTDEFSVCDMPDEETMIAATI